ncbi:MAG: GDSL-type esterase/lipase family protein [Kiritimatiellae bacterium]|nr:GDSL-type esterase/lipase family protein [Kiritimatiellia bacterium]
MKKNIVFGLAALAAAACRADAVHDMTEAKTWTDAGGKTFRYRWHAPAKIEQGRKYPLVVLMHGAGERGTNNVDQLAIGATEVLKYAVESGNDCFFLAGQVPGNQQWVDVPWSHLDHRMPEKPSETMALQMAFMEKLFAELPVDRDRVYATGISMGGYGTWDLVSRKPEWFAAAMPVCGGADVRQAWKFKNVPTWTHHGDKDGVVPFARSRRMTAALWDLGCPVKYTEHPNVGHGSWTPAYGTRKNLEWLFSQKRKAVPRVPFASGDKIAFLGDSITQFGAERPTGYVHLVMDGLAAQGVKAELVAAGVSGNMSHHMRARLQKDVLDKKPRWMFFSCGVNDAPNGYEDARKNPGHPLKEYAADVTQIVRAAKQAGVGVIMLEPTPVVEEPHLANENEKPYVEAFRKIAAAEKCPIVPLNAVFNSVIAAKENPFKRELTRDGTHMAPAGDRLMAEVILRTLGW